MLKQVLLTKNSCYFK